MKSKYSIVKIKQLEKKWLVKLLANKYIVKLLFKDIKKRQQKKHNSRRSKKIMIEKTN